MKFATTRPLVLFLLVAAVTLASCRQTDLGVGGIVIGKVLGGAMGELGSGVVRSAKKVRASSHQLLAETYILLGKELNNFIVDF